MQPFRSFPNFNKCRPEAAGDVVSGIAVKYVSLAVHASFGDYRATVLELVDYLFGWTRFAHFRAVHSRNLRLPEAASDGLSGRFVTQLSSINV